MKEKEVDIDFGQIWKTMQEFKKRMQDETEKDCTLNIMIAGKTGAGKSTLINAVFGKELAKAGQGKPVTQEIESYTDGELTIYDTKGLEVNDCNALEKIREHVASNSRKDVQEQIHLAWVCIAEGQRRIEDADKQLFDLFKENGIPTIAVVTKAVQDKDESGNKFSDVVKEKLRVDEKHFERVRALEVEDDDGETKELKGIKELLEKSYALLDEAKERALKRKQEYDKETQRKFKKEDALSLVKKYSLSAGAVAATPIPFSDIALLLPAQCAMIAHINSVYGVKLDEEGMKKTAIAFLGVVATGFAVRFGVGNLVKFVPGVGSIAGGALNAAVATTTTTMMGKTYIAFLDDHYDDLLNDLGSSLFDSLDSSTLAKYKDLIK